MNRAENRFRNTGEKGGFFKNISRFGKGLSSLGFSNIKIFSWILTLVISRFYLEKLKLSKILLWIYVIKNTLSEGNMSRFLLVPVKIMKSTVFQCFFILQIKSYTTLKFGNS